MLIDKVEVGREEGEDESTVELAEDRKLSEVMLGEGFGDEFLEQHLLLFANECRFILFLRR